MLLTLSQFEKKVMGTVVRDGQCVALFRQYAQDCFGIPHTGSVEGAINLWTNATPLMHKYFDFIKDTGELVNGDCIILSPTQTNRYGHVAIIIDCHGDGVNVIEQDGFKLSGVKPGFWTFKRFVGALRCKDAEQWDAG